MNATHFASLYPADTRFQEIEKILQFVKEGNSAQLIGLPGVGKSNILNLLTYNHDVREKHLGENQKWFHFVSANFSEVKQKPLAEVIKFIFLELVESLAERKMDEEYALVQKIFKESLEYHDELVLFQGLKKTIDYLAIEKQYTIVFLFDRFEEYIPSITSDFFSNLRVLRNRAKYRFSVVFSLNRPLETTIEPTLLSDYYEFLADHLVFLPINDNPGMQFRIAYLEKTTGKTLDKKVLSQILELTGGHGKLTRLCIEQIISQTPQAISPELFLSHKPIQGGLYELWYFLTPEEQKLLLSKQATSSAFLEQIGLIKNEKITIPLFASFIKEKLQSENLLREPIVYNPETNIITKGQAVISERLTVSEFRLLSYLLRNADKILERDQLISAVWQDAASTAGVTDQALDQLIFRLRKKIEDDPNSPQHIQTVKGRGVRFTS